jgi:two-component system invasion response regulator UvrY
MIRILIADDHPIVREGLKRVLSECADIEVIAEAVDGTDALTQCIERELDVILLDISMPGPSFLETLRMIRAIDGGPHVLMLSMHAEEQYAMRSLRAGAAGYLSKEFSPEQLASAIRLVAGGGKYVSEALAQLLAFDLAPDAQREPYELLSDREYQVFCMLGSGRSVGEIGSELALSPKTISTYRARILEKLGLKSSAEIIHFAVRNEFVD